MGPKAVFNFFFDLKINFGFCIYPRTFCYIALFSFSHISHISLVEKTLKLFKIQLSSLFLKGNIIGLFTTAKWKFLAIETHSFLSDQEQTFCSWDIVCETRHFLVFPKFRKASNPKKNPNLQYQWYHNFMPLGTVLVRT